MSPKPSLVSRWIFDEFALHPASLVVSRVLIAVWFLLIGMPRHLWMAEFPSAFYTPPLGLGLFFESQPAGWVFQLLAWFLATLSCLLMVGWRTREVGLSMVLLVVVGNSFDYSFGKINHDILFVALLSCLSFSEWGRSAAGEFVVDSRARTSTRWPLALLALIVSLGMCAAALPKMATGWLDPDQYSTRGHLIFNILGTERPTWLGEWMVQHLGPVAWKAIDYATVLLELSFLAAMFSLHQFRWICALAVFFHAGIHFSMDILFWENLLAYGMFVEWTRVLPLGLVQWIQRTCTGIGTLPAFAFSLLLGTAFTGVYIALGNPVNAALGPLRITEWIWSSVLMVLMVLLASAYLARIAFHAWRFFMAKSVSDSVPIGSGPLVLFDGYCGLCDRFVDFVLRHDQKGIVRFAALQSDLGKNLLKSHGIPSDYADSIVFIHQGQTQQYSTAALSVLGLLGWPWKLAVVFLWVPQVLRDWVYDVIANNRYKWFGKHDTCRLPTPAERGRFFA